MCPAATGGADVPDQNCSQTTQSTVFTFHTFINNYATLLIVSIDETV